MDSNTFREFGKTAIDFVADYLDTIKECDVLPSVEPGYLLELLDTEMPSKPQSWSLIFEDINRYIKPGLTHWQSPNMHAFYPTATSFPSIVGELLSAAFGVVGFNWISSPACTELEMVVMDWLAKFLKLPKHFLHESEGPGGGVIQGSASEAILIAVLTAREVAVRRLKAAQPNANDCEIRGKLVAYSSDQCNSCVEKAGLLAVVPFRLISTAESNNCSLNGKALAKALDEDISKGYIPIICVATLGTTTTCAFDDISSLAAVCQKYSMWLHVDAAYAGGVLALEEYSILHKGLDLIDSLNFNLHKMMMVNFDCCAMWMKNTKEMADSFNVTRIYLKHEYEGQLKIPDFRHWQISLGRRFRALKVWITMRCTGAEGFKTHLRHHIRLAKYFESMVDTDIRFELMCPSSIGLVCFRIKGDNQRTTKLLQLLTERKKIYMIQATKGGKNFLRFVVAGFQPKLRDIEYAWSEIQTHCNILLQMENDNESTKTDFKWTKHVHDNKAKSFEKLL